MARWNNEGIAFNEVKSMNELWMKDNPSNEINEAVEWAVSDMNCES